MKHLRLLPILLVLVLPHWLTVTVGWAGEWGHWRGDANRSGATTELGPTAGRLAWTHELGAPNPAYDHQYRMCADVTYAPIAAAGLVFVPSNVTDEVRAFDLTTGALRWRFFTEGPVRFAPAYGQGTLFFVSDDGYLYAVSPRDGALRWRVRGAPDGFPDSRLLVNGRLCSRWPARGGPVVYEGVVYFGAGLWPEEGAYVCAVDAATGKQRWRSDALSYVKNGMSDHGKPYDLSLPPHGYLAVIDGKLAVPSGRSLAAWFDLKTGELEPYTCFYVKTNPPRGTWYAAGIDHYCVQGGNWFGTRPDAAPAIPQSLKEAKQAVFWSREMPDNERYVVEHRPFLRADRYNVHDENLYTEPVLTETVSYASEFRDDTKYLVPRGHTQVAFPAFDRLVARDLTKPKWTVVNQRHFAYGKEVVKSRRLDFPVLWELDSPLRVLVKAGNLLYAGGADTVAAIAPPVAGAGPRVVWEAPVAGTPVHALVTDGRLVVTTDTGNVYCFANEGRAANAPPARPAGSDPPPPVQYAWVIGWGDGKRPVDLAEREGYRVVVTESDAAVAQRARQTLAERGLYGQRVQVIVGEPSGLQVAPYWVSRLELVASSQASSPTALETVLAALRPYTGVLWLAADGDQEAALNALLAQNPSYELERHGRALKVCRVAPPAGSAEWTHEAGGPGNTFANAEQNVRWPLAALWYSGDIDRYFTPATHFQHERDPYPLVVAGRMFLITGQYLHAVDIYTGSYLWKAELPLTPWVRTRYFDSRRYGRPTDCNYVAAADLVYAVSGDKVHLFEAATGREVKTFEVPTALRGQLTDERYQPQQVHYMGADAAVQAVPPWTEVRLWNDLLLAVIGNTLIAVDRHSGEVRWQRASTRQTTTYALSETQLFGLDCNLPKLLGSDDKQPVSGLLYALDPATGRVLWQQTREYAPVPRHEVDNVRLWLRPILPVLAYNAKHRLLVMTVNRGSLYVFRAANGEPVWSKLRTDGGNLQSVYPPAVTDDYVVLSHYKGCFGYLLDVRTGEEAGKDTGIPRPRTCARLLGNNHLLVYRDAATEMYDVDADRMVEFNSVRSGCTTSFLPAGGIMTAPMLGHGCVCNYPMFASLALYHWPPIDDLRPAAVKGSWTNQAAPLLADLAADPFATAEKPVDASGFTERNATVRAADGALAVSTNDESAGYVVRPLDEPKPQVTLSCWVKRAPGSKRHGNAFLVLGAGPDPKDWVEFRLYYGGRSSLALAGGLVEGVEQKVSFSRRDLFAVKATVNCQTGQVLFEVGGATLRAKLNRPVASLTHYGCGGANSDNHFTPLQIQ